MYIFSLPTLNCKYDRSWAYWSGLFTYDELEKIIKLGDALPKQRAEIAGNVKGNELEVRRNNGIAWMSTNEDTKWIYQKITECALTINKEYFGFDLTGFVEDFQYTVYEGKEHYDWHIDSNGKGKPPRKLSFSLQLTDPMQYEGGELRIKGFLEDILPKTRGTIFFFPSYTLHKVTPVTEGVRKSLVGWIAGPEFR